MHDTRRTRLVLTALLIVAVTLITLDFRSGGRSPLRGIGADIFGPVERGAGYVTRPVASAFDSVVGSDGARIAGLQAQNDELRAELSQAQVNAAAAPQLAGVLRLAGSTRYRIVTANVIGAGGSYSDTVTIDAGTQNGVRVNDTVLNGSGLVGTVTQAGSATSTVLLASDAGSVVGVRLEPSGDIGAVSGTGTTMAQSGTLRLELFTAGAVLKPGQELVTFGSIHNTPYVPGVPVGQITQVVTGGNALTPVALVHPFADFNSLGVVGVVIEPQPRAG